MNITENNKLIAEFMGWKVNLFDKTEYCTPHSILVREEASPISMGYQEYEYNNKTTHSLEKMLFHSSWEWLMPVVEKIESIKNKHGFLFLVKILGNRCIIETHNYSLVDVISKVTDINKKESTYKAVVEFIKWYNENK